MVYVSLAVHSKKPKTSAIYLACYVTSFLIIQNDFTGTLSSVRTYLLDRRSYFQCGRREWSDNLAFTKTLLANSKNVSKNIARLDECIWHWYSRLPLSILHLIPQLTVTPSYSQYLSLVNFIKWTARRIASCNEAASLIQSYCNIAVNHYQWGQMGF